MTRTKTPESADRQNARTPSAPSWSPAEADALVIHFNHAAELAGIPDTLSLVIWTWDRRRQDQRAKEAGQRPDIFSVIGRELRAFVWEVRRDREAAGAFDDHMTAARAFNFALEERLSDAASANEPVSVRQLARAVALRLPWYKNVTARVEWLLVIAGWHEDGEPHERLNPQRIDPRGPIATRLLDLLRLVTRDLPPTSVHRAARSTGTSARRPPTASGRRARGPRHD